MEAEAGQLRKELAKARRCAAALQEQLQALQSKFEKAVLAARRYAAMAFGSLSERLGSEAGKAALEADPECPNWLWDDRFLAPSGEAAEGADGEDAARDAADGDAAPAQPRIRRPRKIGRPNGAKGGRKIGDEVPTITCRLEPDEPVCPGCGGERKIIRTETAERLHYVPANYVRIAIERPVLGCARCRQKAPAQAPAPDWLIRHGLPTEATLAHTMASKFQDHLPIYRQAQRLARHGIRIGTATLNGWLRQGFRVLEPVCEAIRRHVFAAERLFLDETTVRFLEPGFGKARIGYLWTELRDDRSFAGSDPPAAFFRAEPGRAKGIPEAMLRDFSGLAQTDRYPAYNVLTDPARPGGAVRLQFCMAHWRRKFHHLPASRFRDAALQRIATLFAIEAPLQGKPPDQRLRQRQQTLKPAFEQWLRFLQAAAEHFPKASVEAAAIRYGFADDAWPGFCRLLEDGQLDIHSNPVENIIRPVKLTQRNALFAGSRDALGIWARANTLITTCRLNGLDPEAWFTHALIEIRDGCDDVERLLPWHPLPTQTQDRCLTICGSRISPREPDVGAP